MNNNIILSLGVTLIPILAITFVLIVLLHKIYFKIRCKFNAKVNCWFCNHNTKVPFLERNCWTCPECEQYNGFTKDGDYNREIFEQLDCSNLSKNNKQNVNDQLKSSIIGGESNQWLRPPSNGFCDACNEAQRLKIERIAQFEPKNESRFDEELKIYKEKLENEYRLCETCDRHLNKVLKQKKRMIIGSKFLEFVMKGAQRFKEPYLLKVRQHIHEKRKQRLNRIAIILTLVNILCLLKLAPVLKREQVQGVFGETFGKFVFIALSHFWAFGRFLMTCFENLTDYEIIEKSKLFLQTIFMMVTYSLGLRLPQNTQTSFTSLFVEAFPFILLGLSFAHNTLDGLKITRFTYLLLSWSAFAGRLFDNQAAVDPKSLMLLNSLMTLLLTFTAKHHSLLKLHDSSANGLHKIYSEDYFSDEDTISMLSEQINCSNSSIKSGYSMNNSFGGPSASLLNKQKSPITSSTYSLNGFSKKQISPNSSFNGCFPSEANRQQPFNETCNNSIYGFPRRMPPLLPRTPLFASNLELNSQPRAASTLPHNSFLNQSFASAYNREPLSSSFSFQKGQEAQNFYSNGNINASISNMPMQSPFQRNFCVASSLHSPFSMSTTGVFQPDKTSNLLLPSRFSTNCLANNSSNINSWLNSNPVEPTQSILHKERNVFIMKDLEENLSRTSSHSSGFESHGGPPNVSRENSCLPEINDIFQRTSQLDTSSTHFRPLTSRADLPFLSENHQSSLPHNGSSFYQRRNTPSAFRESSHLNKIHEEQASFRKGDLLRKWQESQNPS